MKIIIAIYLLICNIGIAQEFQYLVVRRDVSAKKGLEEMKFIPTELGKYTCVINVLVEEQIDSFHYRLKCKAYSRHPFVGQENDKEHILANEPILWYRYDQKRRKLSLHSKEITTNDDGEFSLIISKGNESYFVLMVSDKEGVSFHYEWK